MEKKNIVKKILTIIVFILFILTLVVAGIYVVVNDFIDERLKNLNYVDLYVDDLEVNNTLQDNDEPEVMFEEIKTIALFGSDSRNVEDISQGRADCIMVASLNPKTKSIKLLSIPRDTYVNIPGYGYDKINHAYSYGKEQLLVKTINSNFGLNVTEYVTIDFLGLVNVINKIGGIEMEVTEAEMNVINQYLVEIYALEGLPYESMTEYGKLVLTGEQAVGHCRNRYVGSDFTRAERQRNVIMAVIQKVSLMEKEDAIEILDFSLSQIQTNVDVKSYLPQITNVVINLKEYKNNIISAQVPDVSYGDNKMINGIYYFGADLEKCKQEFYSYIYEK